MFGRWFAHLKPETKNNQNFKIDKHINPFIDFTLFFLKAFQLTLKFFFASFSAAGGPSIVIIESNIFCPSVPSNVRNYTKNKVMILFNANNLLVN